jgi:hypothetical protein
MKGCDYMDFEQFIVMVVTFLFYCIPTYILVDLIPRYIDRGKEIARLRAELEKSADKKDV